VTAAACVSLVAALAIIVAACGGDDEAQDTPVRSPTADATTLPRTASSSPDAGSPSSGASVEVQGIVGSVDAAQRTIRINRLQGAEVEIIELSTATRIRGATGSVVRLTDIRPSDRVVARGRVEGASLIATEVTVSQVVPGGPPGG
jgi:hypothetical protein